MPIYTLHNKKTGETSQVSCPYDEMKKRIKEGSGKDSTIKI